MKKILAIHGSHRPFGITKALADSIVLPLQDLVTIKAYDVQRMQVDHCLACLACAETGDCIIRDDMDSLYSDLEAADVVILTSPIYFNHISSRLKQVIDRLEPYFYRKMKLKIPPKPKLFFLVCSSGIEAKEASKTGIISTITILTKAFNSALNDVVWIEETDQLDLETLSQKYQQHFDQIIKSIEDMIIR
jgi:multimeric flavodoxin WrbA